MIPELPVQSDPDVLLPARRLSRIDVESRRIDTWAEGASLNNSLVPFSISLLEKKKKVLHV